MKTPILLCLLAFFVAPSAHADDACYNDAKDQYSNNQCAQKDAAAADARLNAVYRELIAAQKSDRVAADAIRKAQRAWIAFRDADIEANFPAQNKMLEYGSMYPQCRAMAVEAVTRFRTAQLCAQFDKAAPACEGVDMNPKMPEIGC